jgi:molybdopterin synthase catalytic subunit/molybdopterin converting factor small subunit
MPDEDELILVNVHFFAYLKEAIGANPLKIKLCTDSCIRDLKQKLIRDYPVVQEILTNAIAAVNHNFADDCTIIPPNAEVAFFPPVSGGEEKPTIIEISEKKTDFNELLAKILNSQIGGVCIFLGVVRGSDPRKKDIKIHSLEYQAYIPMAKKKIFQITNEIRAKWSNIFGIAVVQQLGVFLPGEISTIIACSSGHRDDGIFEACRYAIDRLKQIVPVWKKEIGEGGLTWIEGDYIPHHGD